jgi:hypothetical protein
VERGGVSAAGCCWWDVGGCWRVVEDGQRKVFWKWMTEPCRSEDGGNVIVLDSRDDPEEMRDWVLKRIMG